MNTQQASLQCPEPDSADIEHFQVYSRVEILSLLRTIRDQRALVTIHFSRGEDFLVTNLLSVNPEFEELVLDAGADPAQNMRMFASQGLTAVAFIDKVKVQFSTHRAEKTVHEGHDAIRIRLPDSLLRLQRRDAYRVPTPVARPVKCSVASPKAASARVEMIVVDISSTGIGVVVDPEQLAAQPGLLLRDFRLDMGEAGSVEGTLEVRHVSEAGRGSTRRHRLGCTFVRMPGTMTTLVQRYVTALERERLTRR